jgi:predicted transcriptional regulator
MNSDLPLKIESLGKYHATMTKEEVAEALGVTTHIIPPLTRAGLIKPLGRPQRYCVKRYSRDVLARQIADVNWLDKVVAAIHRHWRVKNAHKLAKQAGNGSAQPNGNPKPILAAIKAGESVTG